MASIWKDLLFLHGHLIQRDRLAWRPDAPAQPTAKPRATERVAPPTRTPARDTGHCTGPACA